MTKPISQFANNGFKQWRICKIAPVAKFSCATFLII